MSSTSLVKASDEERPVRILFEPDWMKPVASKQAQNDDLSFPTACETTSEEGSVSSSIPPNATMGSDVMSPDDYDDSHKVVAEAALVLEVQTLRHQLDQCKEELEKVQLERESQQVLLGALSGIIRSSSEEDGKDPDMVEDVSILSANQAVEMTIRSLKQQIEALEDEREQFIEDIHTLEATVAELRASNETLSKEHKEMRASVERLESEIEARNFRVQVLEKIVSNHEQEEAEHFRGELAKRRQLLMEDEDDDDTSRRPSSSSLRSRRSKRNSSKSSVASLRKPTTSSFTNALNETEMPPPKSVFTVPYQAEVAETAKPHIVPDFDEMPTGTMLEL